ncbi:MAG: PhnA-like protein [Geminicoccaceae bacterium]
MAERTRAATYPVGPPEVAAPTAGLRRISWGAVLAGAAIVAAVHLSLSLLGFGIGMSTVDPAAGDSPQVSSMGIGAGAWWVISNLIALVIGGYVAARLSGMPVRGDGIIHGLLTWAITLLITMYLLTTSVGSIVGGAFNVVGDTVSGVGQSVAEAAPEVADAAGLSAEQVQEEAEQLLRREQPGGMSAERARSELVDTLRQMVTGSEQEAAQARERAATIIAEQAGISPEQANQRLDQLRAEVQQRTDQAAEQATEAADAAASAASSASIWGFVALVLGACAAALGGAMGTRDRFERAY